MDDDEKPQSEPPRHWPPLPPVERIRGWWAGGRYFYARGYEPPPQERMPTQEEWREIIAPVLWEITEQQRSADPLHRARRTVEGFRAILGTTKKLAEGLAAVNAAEHAKGPFARIIDTMRASQGLPPLPPSSRIPLHPLPLHANKTLWGFMAALGATCGTAILAVQAQLVLPLYVAGLVFFWGCATIGFVMLYRENEHIRNALRVLGSLAIAAGIIAYLYSSRSHLTAPSSDAPSRAQRVIVNRTLPELHGFYRGRTDAEGDRLIQPYIGKWIRVSGKVSNVTPSSGAPAFTYVTLAGRSLIPDSLTFGPIWKDKILVMRQGDRIAAICRIGQPMDYLIALDDCELLR